MRDRLTKAFPYALALVLPLAGAILAVVRLQEGNRVDALRLALTALIGLCVLALLLTG
ncbi:MAG: hypothetical protein ACRDLN_02160 [Solirubrobacteraceae bacterium]